NESNVKTVLLAKLRTKALASTRADPTSEYARAISNLRRADAAVSTKAATIITSSGAPSAPHAVTISRMMTSILWPLSGAYLTDSTEDRPSRLICSTVGREAFCLILYWLSPVAPAAAPAEWRAHRLART